MIKQVTLRYFKRFQEEIFDVSGNVVLAGPNNSGKSTLLQALAVWNLAKQKWLSERGPESGSKARKRTGVAITRKDFTAIPLREMNLLWHNRSTALHKDELQNDQKLGTPRILEISVDVGDWGITFECIYRYPELIHVRPSSQLTNEQIEKMRDIQFVYVPTFSGIGVEENRVDKEYQDYLIGQGKPGDILRNLLLEIYQEKPVEWETLRNDIKGIFDYHLLPPKYKGPFIVCEYQPGVPDRQDKIKHPKFDISSAGSGFLQVLMLLGFFYARPVSILLLDEPDAHLHIILQKQVYDRLRDIARKRRCQLIIATHSEVLIESTSPENILSFYKQPHKLDKDIERTQIREALKRLTCLDILLSEQCQGILYVESESDLNLLREFARILQHDIFKFLSKDTFWHNNQGRDPREAKGHLFALRAINKDIKGVLLVDGDNRNLLDHELTTEGMTILRWNRYEIESYLTHFEVLKRFASQLTIELFLSKGIEYLNNKLPNEVLQQPLAESGYHRSVKVSEDLLPGFFIECDINIPKNEYYQIAAQMKPDEIPNEVKEKLDLIYQALELQR